MTNKPIVYEEIEILDGAATQIQLPDASIDVITIAQAFHWFANKDSLKEFHRVLKPNGKSGLQRHREC